MLVFLSVVMAFQNKMWGGANNKEKTMSTDDLVNTEDIHRIYIVAYS